MPYPIAHFICSKIQLIFRFHVPAMRVQTVLLLPLIPTGWTQRNNHLLDQHLPPRDISHHRVSFLFFSSSSILHCLLLKIRLAARIVRGGNHRPLHNNWAYIVSSLPPLYNCLYVQHHHLNAPLPSLSLVPVFAYPQKEFLEKIVWRPACQPTSQPSPSVGSLGSPRGIPEKE